MNFIKKSIFIILVSFFFSFSAKAEVNVVTTIKPLHSLVSSVMKGVGEPSLIIEGTNNPHTFVFKPSHAEMIENADIVFWIGKDLEAFMEKPLDSLAKNAKTIAFMDLASIEKLKFREQNIFDDHDDHGHDDHDDHGHKDDDHDDHDDHDGHDDHGGLILSNYMQKDAEFNGYEFELGRSINLNGGSMSFSYGMDYVNAKFKDGGYVPRINPRRHIFSIDYAKEGYSASLTLRNVKSQNKLSLNETPTESYNMLDMKVSQSIPIMSGDGEMLVTLYAKNILDEVARNHSSFVKDQVPLPGRNIGLRFNMKF